MKHLSRTEGGSISAIAGAPVNRAGQPLRNMVDQDCLKIVFGQNGRRS
jgi:hypothetical protein